MHDIVHSNKKAIILQYSIISVPDFIVNLIATKVEPVPVGQTEDDCSLRGGKGKRRKREGGGERRIEGIEKRCSE